MKLHIRLHGAFMTSWADHQPCRIAGLKQQALLALLAAAPEYARTRTWLIARLWSESDEEKGRRNLRQLLHGLRAALGGQGAGIVGSEGDLLYLSARHVVITGSPAEGTFMEGFDLAEEGFEDWLREQRQAASVAMPSARAPEPRPPARDRARYRIAVLPFVESGTEIEPGVGDALAHQLSVAFARSGLVDAISHFSSRQSSPAAEGGDVDFQVTGRCFHAGAEIGIDVTLEDAGDGTILWGERFTERCCAVTSGDGQLIETIAGQCLWLVAREAGHLSTIRPVGQARAHVLMMNGIVHMHSFDRARFAQARRALEEVVTRCPDSPLPLAWLAQWHLLSVYQGWSDDPARTRRLAFEATGRALDLNPCCELSLAIDGNLLNVLDSDFTAAAQRFATARAINPSSALISQLSAVLCCFTGQGAEAVALTERARSLSPRDPRRAFFAGIGAASYLVAGRWGEAVSEAEAALLLNPGHVSAMRCRVIGLQSSGRHQDAALAAQDLMSVCPRFSVSGYLRDHPAAETPVGRQWAVALGDAGIPAT